MSFFGSAPATTASAFQPAAAQFQFQQPQQQQQQQQNVVQPQSQMTAQSLQDVLQNATALTMAVSGPELFGDDRDRVVAFLNQLLAALGEGAGYFRPDQPPFPFTQSNLFYRLKGVGYNRLSKHKNADGIVSLILATAPTNFAEASQKIKVADALNAILRTPKPTAAPMLLGSLQQQQQQQPQKPSLHIDIKSIIPLDEQHTEVVVVAKEFGGGRAQVPAIELYNELVQKANELRQQLCCQKVVPRVEVDPAELENYLRRPPPGFEEIWPQAIRENPDPERLIPYPIQGFQQLLQRKKQQTSLVASLQAGFDDYMNRLSHVQNEILNGRSRYAKIVQTQKQLSNRLLLVLATQAQSQRFGQMVKEKEEQLQCRLESLNMALNGPAKLKEQVSEMYTTLRRDNGQIRQQIQERAVKAGQQICQQDMGEVRRCLATRQQLLENLVAKIGRAHV